MVRTDVFTNLAVMLSGTISASDFNLLLNKAVRDVVGDIDLPSCKRKAALAPNLFDDVYQYGAPTDLKSDRIIDVKPQIGRGRFDDWTFTTAEEFDRLKNDQRLDNFGDQIKVNQSANYLGKNLIALQRNDMVKKVLLSKPVVDYTITIDALSALGSWVLFGDGTNLRADSANYVQGSASLEWDISAAGGTTAGVQNSSLTADITDYLTEGSIFVWAYITSTTYLTNFKLRIGSSTSAYYTITITTNSEGTAFTTGWNLLRFDLVNGAQTGTVVPAAITHVALYMTKNALKISETNYRFDNILLKRGPHYDLVYYSRYGWQTNAGVYIEASTADTDVLNMETDEYTLIEEKTLEYCERKLKNSAKAKEHYALYEKKKADFVFENPSEAMLQQQTYYNLR